MTRETLIASLGADVYAQISLTPKLKKTKTLLTSTNYIRCTAKPRAVTVQNDYTADPRCYKKHQNSKKYRRRGSTATKERKKTPSLQP